MKFERGDLAVPATMMSFPADRRGLRLGNNIPVYIHLSLETYLHYATF